MCLALPHLEDESLLPPSRVCRRDGAGPLTPEIAKDMKAVLNGR